MWREKEKYEPRALVSLKNNVKKILLDPGHSEKNPGAPLEHKYDVICASIVKDLLKNKAVVDIYDPLIDNKTEIGEHAKGYDLLLSLHHNAFNKIVNYSMCGVTPKYNEPLSANTLLASRIAVAIAQALELKPYQEKLWPIGVMPTNLIVLNAAHRVGCKHAILIEPFFIDCHKNEFTIVDAVNKSMAALAEVLIKEFL